MKLFTKELIKKTPKIGSNENTSMDDLVFHIKLFTPWSNWTWYIAEADFETGEAFGLVKGLETELGYFDLNELQQIKGPFGLKIERDMHFISTEYRDLR